MELLEFDTSEQLRHELVKLSADRLLPSVMFLLGLSILLAVMSQFSYIDALSVSWCVGVAVIVICRAVIAVRLRRYTIEEGVDSHSERRVNRASVLFSISDGIIWLAGAWIFLNRGLVNYQLIFALSLIAAATFGLIYIFNTRAAAACTSVILLSCTGLALFYSDVAAYQVLLFGAVFSIALITAIAKLREILIANLDAKFKSELVAAREKESNLVYNQHWQNTPLAAVEWDKRFRICSWNPSAASIFGYSVEEALGKPLEMIMQGEDLEKTKRKWRALWRSKGGFRSIHKCLNKDGEVVHCEWHDAAIMRSGESVGICSFIEDITAQMKAEEIIKQQANYDSLTGLPNRRQIMQEINRAIHRSQRSKKMGALVFLDLDHFKDINDTQGHDVGDIVLKAFAEKVSALVRSEDMVARFGGDEFVVLLENVGMNVTEAAANVKAVTDKILHVGQSLCKVGDIEYDLDVSGGIVLFDGHWDEKDILKKADLAMYRVKSDGRKGMTFYDDSLSIETEYRVELIRGLRKGLENNEFDLHYQPILDTEGRIQYSEALLRWVKPPNKVVPAGHFIEVMSNSPMMGGIGYWIVDRVCQSINTMIKNDMWSESQAIFVNISPKQLTDERFASKVQAILESNGVDPSNIVFEITEDSLIQNYDEVMGQLKELIGMGIRLALDDFGTGYSSLAMLKDLPVHYVKLDREFISTLLENQNNYLVVNAIIKLCEILSLKVIAEGIEEKEQFAALKTLSCDYFQGYMFHKPMPFSELMIEIAPERKTQIGGKKFKPEHLRLVE